MTTVSPLRDPWHNTLLVELRTRNVPGPRIGEILAEVDTHCADSGTTPAEAFGDPAVYARSFAATASKPSARQIISGAWSGFAMMIGMVATLEGFSALSSHTDATIRYGGLVPLVVIPLVMAAYVAFPGSFRKLYAVLGAGMLVTIVPQFIWRDTALTLPAWPTFATGLVMFLLAWWPTTTCELDDIVVDPRTGEDALSTPRWITAALRWGLPVILLATALATFTAYGAMPK
jgi:hypothetical protein